MSSLVLTLRSVKGTPRCTNSWRACWQAAAFAGVQRHRKAAGNLAQLEGRAGLLAPPDAVEARCSGLLSSGARSENVTLPSGPDDAVHLLGLGGGG